MREKHALGWRWREVIGLIAVIFVRGQHFVRPTAGRAGATSLHRWLRFGLAGGGGFLLEGFLGGFLAEVVEEGGGD